MKKFVILTLAVFCLTAFVNAQTREPGPNKVGVKVPASSITVQQVDGTTLTPTNLVEAILGPGVTFSNVQYIGTQAPASPASAGTFANGVAAGIGIESGILLSSGYVVNAIGPNINDGITGQIGTGGDADLTALSGQTTYDRTVLEFDFVPNADNIYIDFCFASDEYNEFVYGINDIFAFFINGVNIALVPATNLPVAINTINNGNPYGTLPNSYPQYYLNNDLSDGGPFFDIEADGFTTVIRGQGVVVPNQTNHIKIAIADASDSILDSWVFIKAGSFTTVPDVPISSWALFIGLGLIIAFTLIRFRKLS